MITRRISNIDWICVSPSCYRMVRYPNITAEFDGTSWCVITDGIHRYDGFASINDISEGLHHIIKTNEDQKNPC